MRKLKILFLLLILTIAGFGQNQLLVTDFVFFNTLDNPSSPNIPNYLMNDATQLDLLKSQLNKVLEEKFEVENISYDSQAVQFLSITELNPTKGYKGNHKTLVKKGGFDYYLTLLSFVKKESSSFHYILTMKVSDKKGKKITSENLDIPFDVKYKSEEIATSDLLAKSDFFDLISSSFPAVFNEKKSLEKKQFYRIGDPAFNEFIGVAKRYSMDNYKSLRPVFMAPGEAGITIQVSGGLKTDSEISDGGELLYGTIVDDPSVIGVRNPMLTKNWTAFVKPNTNEAFGNLDIAPSADISLKIGDDQSKLVRLINGRLSAKLNDKAFLFSYEPSAELMRVFVDKKMVALIQPTESVSNGDLKIFFQGEEQDLAFIISLNQVYHQAVFALTHKKSE